MYERLELIFPASGFLLLPHSVNTKIKTNRYVKISFCFFSMVHFQAPKAATLCYCQMFSFLSGRVGREVACEQALWLRKGRRESAKKRREKRGLVTPQSLLHSPLGHFTLTQFFFGTSSGSLFTGQEGGGMYRVLSRSYSVQGAAILGSLFQGNKIAANVEIQICMRFYFRDVYKHPHISCKVSFVVVLLLKCLLPKIFFFA